MLTSLWIFLLFYNFPALGWVCKHTDQSPSGCCGVRLERGEQETEKASARPGDLPPISTAQKPPNSIVKGVQNIGVTLRMGILETYNSRAAETRQHSIQDAFKNYGTEHRRTGPRTVGQYPTECERPSLELALPHTAHGRGQIGTKSTSELRQAREGIIFRWYSQPKRRESYRNCTR